MTGRGGSKRIKSDVWVVEFKGKKLPRMEFTTLKPMGHTAAWAYMKTLLKEQFKFDRVPHGTKLTPGG